MNKTKEEQNYPILLKGILKRDNLWFEVESLQDRLKSSLQNGDYLYKIMFHLTILVFECSKRRNNFLKSLRIDQIYLNKKDKMDSNVFIFEEDQLSSTQKQLLPQQLLFNIFQNLGFDIPYNLLESQEQLINEIFINIFEEKRQDRQIIINETRILEELYNIKIIGDKLYNQSFSKVFLIEKPYYINSSVNQIIVKWVKFRTEEERAYLKTEIKLLESLNDSENFTKMFCYDNFADQQYFFMKHYDKTLDQINNDIGEGALDWGDLMHLIKQMILALKELHTRGIYHRDLKPQNIMFEYLSEVKNIQQMRCVLIDFNRSKLPAYLESQSKDILTYYEGTPEYQPPEGTQEKYGASYDIWQLGYIIQCMLLRRKNKEFTRQKCRPIEEKIYTTIFEKDQEEVKKNYSSISAIVIKMMNHNPSNRPQTLKEIEDFILKLN